MESTMSRMTVLLGLTLIVAPFAFDPSREPEVPWVTLGLGTMVWR